MNYTNNLHMYGHHIDIEHSMDQPGWVANSARRQVNKDMYVQNIISFSRVQTAGVPVGGD